MFCFLYQHPDRIFQEPRHIVPMLFRERLHLRLRGFGPVADAIIYRNCGFHSPAWFDLSVLYNRHFAPPAEVSRQVVGADPLQKTDQRSPTHKQGVLRSCKGADQALTGFSIQNHVKQCGFTITKSTFLRHKKVL